MEVRGQQEMPYLKPEVINQGPEILVPLHYIQQEHTQVVPQILQQLKNGIGQLKQLKR
jgi:hypothetical protein